MNHVHPRDIAYPSSFAFKATKRDFPRVLKSGDEEWYFGYDTDLFSLSKVGEYMIETALFNLPVTIGHPEYWKYNCGANETLVNKGAPREGASYISFRTTDSRAMKALLDCLNDERCWNKHYI
jgi:hypothetical protein